MRPIADAELLGWVEAMHLGFHLQRPAEPEVAYRRDVRQQDLSRTLGVVDDGLVAGTLWSFPAQLTVPGGACLAADAITSVTVRPTHRRRGLLRQLMDVDLRAARERGDQASVLIAAEYPIYGRFGFGPATEQAHYAIDRRAVRFTRAATGRVDVIDPARMLAHAPALFDRFRRLHAGQIDRQPINWETRLRVRPAPWTKDEPPPTCALYVDAHGEPQGYLLYQVNGNWAGHTPAGKLDVVELVALTSDAYLGLWRFACEIDLVTELTAELRRVDEPLGWLLEDPRAAVRQTLRTDLLWLRPLDVAATLSARRYLTEDRLVLEVVDPLGLSGGRFQLDGGPAGATCRPTSESAQVRLSMTALGAIVLGGLSLHPLAEAGAIDELAPGALDTGDRLFRWPRAPWCSTFF